jgi:copper resistance protein C
MKTAMTVALVCACFLMSSIVSQTSAFAHAHLESAIPPVGGMVASSSEIRITFSEAVEPKFTSLTLASDAGVAEPLGASALDPNDAKTLVVKIAEPLPPGVYKVTWHAMSIDTHHTQGDFSFIVKP